MRYVFLAIILALFGLGICTPIKQLRSEYVARNCEHTEADCRNSVVERCLEYDLGFIQFADRGSLKYSGRKRKPLYTVA